MSMPLKAHDYIGLSEFPSMENSENPTDSSEISEKNKGLNLKATELRLGLPGSQSPERELCFKGLVSGAKRGFSDTLDVGSRKWVFTGSGGSELDLAKNGSLFSPRGVNGGEVNTQQSSMASNAVKEAVQPAPKLVQDKKPQIPSAAKAQVVGWPPVRSFRKNSMASNQPKNDDEADAKSGSGCLYVKVSMEGAPYLRKVDLKIYGSYAEMSSALEKMFSCFTIDEEHYSSSLLMLSFNRKKVLTSGIMDSRPRNEMRVGCISHLDHEYSSPCNPEKVKLDPMGPLTSKFGGQCGSDGVPGRDGLSESRLMDLLHGSEYVLTYEDKDGDWMLVGDVPWEMFIDSCKRLRIMKSSDVIGLAPRAMEKCKNRK